MMTPGDLIRFWDFQDGEGFVWGLVIDTLDHRYTSDGDFVKSVEVAYKNTIQMLPLDNEWVVETIQKGEKNEL